VKELEAAERVRVRRAFGIGAGVPSFRTDICGASR